MLFSLRNVCSEERAIFSNTFEKDSLHSCPNLESKEGSTFGLLRRGPIESESSLDNLVGIKSRGQLNVFMCNKTDSSEGETGSKRSETPELEEITGSV